MIQAPPTLAANLKWLFSEWPLAERFGAAAACGFRAIELSLPYALPIRQLRQSLEQHQLTYAYLLAAAGDWDAGDRGLACVPGRQAEFRDGVLMVRNWKKLMQIGEFNPSYLHLTKQSRI